ncbi:MAG: aminotransferase class V-fold PLP-dependent enzyme [Candidatus Handelsmanbacteria bacterium]|nr:aminotransferase class V-fold PLP-dependent enzyme [Candidatus Handelsmanbacteria bacterium]
MPNIYEKLGVPTIINASGPATRLSGSIMPVEVAEAMKEASQYCVDIAVLQAHASQYIAQVTGAEAGYVTSGAAAGLLLGTAACVTGLDPTKMNRLPDTRGMKNRVIMARSHRNFYDHAVRSAGVRLVEVGIADRYSGAGVRDTEPWEIEAAIDGQTAAVCYVAYAHSLPPLRQVVEVAHRAGVPVIVDAAGQLPPADNLRRFIAEGADLVAFSGGKAIRGPQSSGILCGKRELIEAAALQHLDLDIYFAQWNPPASLIDKSRLPGAPHHGIGRPCKVGKEEIVGLLTALRLFVEEDPQVRRGRWLKLMEELVAAIGALPHARVELANDPKRSEIPLLALHLDEGALGFSALELVKRLQDGTPGIHANPSRVSEGVVLFGPMCLKEGEPQLAGKRVRELLGG